ncbi:hypothetical protein N9818_00280 [Arcobacteraceae bacterium]|nr:hypothetical protein [Arcobacteraceae bacterium]
MIWILVIIGIILCIYLLVKYSSSSHEKKVNAYVETIKSIKNLESLYNKKYKLEEKMLHSNNYKDDYLMLEEVIDIASNKPYKYYYSEVLTLTRTVKDLQYIGKLIDLETYNTFEDKEKAKFKVIRLGEVENLHEAKKLMNDKFKKDEVKILLKIRKIIESYLSDKEKATQYNQIVVASDFLQELFCFKCKDYYKQYKDIQILEDEKLCLILNNFEKFSKVGYSTLEKILKEDEKKLLKVNGIGKETIAQVQELKNKK